MNIIFSPGIIFQNKEIVIMISPSWEKIKNIFYQSGGNLKDFNKQSAGQGIYSDPIPMLSANLVAVLVVAGE